MKSRPYLYLLMLSLVLVFSCQENGDKPNHEEETITRFERDGSSILKGVKVPDGKSMYFASGIVATEKDANKPVGDRGRFGDTYDQSVSALKRIQSYLGEQGLSLKDVIAMKVYVAPDPENDNKPDFQAWFKAYGEYFGNQENPNKVARSTIGVYTLVDPNKFIEIEVRAVYP
ncbi:RidA family protein [Roseivirga sp. E12]|uniref:RidA family protein n=1 Tax=Roseivirga sp. E12 TaxID=2819237 RepID=UPI001ABC51BE|nr:RidA family protein [Roseivirga sp. E12]MBO3699640.1 RidA family protein [Roseivirga sp. E12]